jgi:polyisoprenoid-binding protein YceI
MRLRTSSYAVMAAALTLAGAAIAQPPGPPPVNTDPAAVPAGAYTVESHHARVLFSVLHFGTSVWYGDFADVKGAATLDPKTPSANSVEVSFPSASVTTTNAILDGELKDPTWFDAAQFPTITFKSTSVTFTGPGKADITGDLTFHGVTKPVVLKAEFLGSGVNMMSHAYTAGFNAVTKINRSDFGVKKYVPIIGDEVTIHISVPFVKTAG